MDHRLYNQLSFVASKLRKLCLWRSLAIVWLIAGLFGCGLLYLRWRGMATGVDAILVLLVTTATVALCVVIKQLVSFRDLSRIATKIEERYPALENRLVTAVEQRPDTVTGRLGYLQQTVVDEALSHNRQHRWTGLVPTAALATAQVFNLPLIAFFAATLVGLFLLQEPAEHAAANKRDSSPEIPLGLPTSVEVDPGNAEIERGTGLVVVAQFTGAIPAEVHMNVTSGGQTQTVEMSRNLEDPAFGGYLREVIADTTYSIEYKDGKTEDYTVTVFEFPALIRADARLEFPEYTGMSIRQIEDTRRVTAVEGTTLTWNCHLNKAVQSAVLVDKGGERRALNVDAADPQLYTTEIVLSESKRWQLELIDGEGRKNKQSFELSAKVLPNRPPELKLTLARDVRVSPIEELGVQANFSDDFGLAKYGISYSIGGAANTDIELGAAIGRNVRREVDHLIDFEALEAEPDQLLAYHFWAEDVSADGQNRRVFSDMFFAEVRHFEEIFREGQSPTSQEQQQQQQQQQQSQNAQQAEQIAELQKQIINGTWNLMRRETGATVSAEFEADVAVLGDAQASVLDQVEELAAEIQDAQSAQYVDNIREHMNSAINRLLNASDEKNPKRLVDALAAEQAAYQALLKLRAREHEVVRSQQQQQGQQSSSSASANRMQQQLQELELNNDENRYETQQQAQENNEEDEQQREARQILNRLRELAQRQEDLNERLKQLQSALEAAEDEEEREEILRQLKRLRDQQEQLLRDTDELGDRMDQAQDQQQVQPSREQLDEARENVQQSTEALSQNNVSEALTQGTRAERQFEELRDEFREQTANQFAEQMRDLQERVQQLDDKEQKIKEQIAELNGGEQNTLRPEIDREQLGDQLQQQRETLEELLNRMQETVQEAEESEPLLAQSLYDSFRQTSQQQIGRELDMASELIRRGFDQEAQQNEATASEGIQQLREGIERASDGILGSDTESLRRALGELDALARQLNQEIEQNDPQQPGEQQSPQPDQQQQDQAGQPQPPTNNNSEQRDNQSRPGQQQAPNGEPSEQQQADQRQPGQEAADQNQPRDGQQPGRVDRQQPNSDQPGEQGEQSQQPGTGGQPGEAQSQQPQDGQPTDSQRQDGNQQSPGQSPNDSQQPGQSPATQPNQGQQPTDQQQNGQPSGSNGNRQQSGGLEQFATETPGAAPLTGDNFRDWSDRLRDVEEMVNDPELRSRAAQIRDRARQMRIDYRQNSKAPQWDLVRKLLASPLAELRTEVAHELLRRSAERHQVVPLDRDPVPDHFTEQVRKYFEQLGSGD